MADHSLQDQIAISLDDAHLILSLCIRACNGNIAFDTEFDAVSRLREAVVRLQLDALTTLSEKKP